MRLLCIGAHSDDLEIGCGGTVLTWLASKPANEVTWVVLSAEGARASEARRSARALLTRAVARKVVIANFRDGYLPAQYTEVKSFFEDLKGEVDPDDGDQYISADDFLYSRCVMLVNGRKKYEAVLKNPTGMARGSEFEAVLSLARDAHELKTGEELDVTALVSYESFSNKAGWKPNAKTKRGWTTSAKVPPLNRRPG